MSTATKPAKPAKTGPTARPGYKHTKLGWIPEEWEVKFLDDVAKRGSGHTPNKSTPEYHNGGIKWISLTDSPRFDKGLISETEFEVSEQGLANSSAVLHPAGTVVLSRDAHVGKSAVMGCDMAVSQHFMTWTCDERLDNWFLYYTLQQRKKEFERIAIGSTIKTIGLPYFKKLKILYPPLPEQRRIAQVLGAWDRAIATVQQLLAAQQERKRGLMQELLTGRRRFKGFGGKWKECELGELGQFRTSSVDKKLVEGQKRVRLVNYMDVYNNQRIHGGMSFMEVTAKDSQLQSSSLRRGDILFTPSSETPDDIGHSAVVVDDMDNTLFSYHVMRFRPHDDTLDLDFRAYVFNNDRILKQFSAKATGSTRYTLSASDFGDTLARFPSDKAEQQAIARLLMASDAEIEALTNQLNHLTTQKRGLMQQLLTGAVRVKV